MTAKIDHELRMYFFVPYNISPIQQAIQAGHAALEYAHKFYDSPLYENFVTRWKTWIILNGGTTNRKLDMITDEFAGSLDTIGQQLVDNKIDCAAFFEPDLNDALTAVCFICDERVFNYEDYPDFINYLLDVKMYPEARDQMPAENIIMLKTLSVENQQAEFPEYYKEWVTLMGGEKNLFLRELLKGKKLA